MLKLLGPALRKINVDPQDLDGATIAELTERCAQPLPADGTGCRIPALQADLDFILCHVPTDAAAADLLFVRFPDCSRHVLLRSISKGIVGTSIVGISSMGGGEERFRQAAEAGRSPPKPDGEGLLPRP